MDLTADELQPAKHQSHGVVAAEADAGDDNNIQASGDIQIPDDDGIPELVQEDDGDETLEPLNRDFVESDEDAEPASPGVGSAIPKLDDRPELELPNAKRSRLSRITAIQNLCEMETFKSRDDVREIVRQLDKNKTYDIKTADKQRKRADKDGAHDVSEVYSPPRVTAMAEKLGLDAGWALDLIVADDDGVAWDFSNQAKRDTALQKIRDDKPFMLITSPICGPFSALHSLFNFPKMNHGRSRGS